MSKEERTSIPEEALEEVSGGYAGSDAYTAQEYSRWGVTWIHNLFSADQYYYRGEQVPQYIAEKIVRVSISKGHILSKTEYDRLVWGATACKPTASDLA